MKTHRQNGFTVLEVTVAATLFAVMLGGAAMALVVDTQTERVLVSQVSPEIAARTALERITTELRMAGVRGEDRNGDGILDPSEDLNENGEMDSDWSLADGATTNAIVFNRRVELRYSKEDMVAQSEYSRAVAFELVGERVFRVTTETVPGQTKPRIVRTVLASKITRLSFSRTRSVITVEIDVRLPKGAYKDSVRTLAMSVRLRN